MGNNALTCCARSDIQNQHSQSSIKDKYPSDLPKIDMFKSRVKMLDNVEQIENAEKLNIIHTALEELDLTNEPVSKHYEFGNVLGAGKYGVVKESKSLKDEKYKVAIKIIKLHKLSSQYHSVIQEILALKKIDHPNVVNVLEIFKDESKLYIVMEYVEGQELFDFVVRKKKLLESEAAIIVQQLLKTIKYLNELNL